MNNNLYDDFSTTTEHFYDELGKLSECETFFTRKEYKRLKNKIITLLFDSLDTLFKKENVTNKVERNELKKEHNLYKAENNTGFMQKAKSLLTMLKGKKETQKLGQTSQQVQIEASRSVEQLPPSQQDITTQTESDVVVEGENSETQEPEKNSQEEQNGDA